MASFMDLPGELRNKIYDLCLYRVAIYPHDRPHKTSSYALAQHPQLQQLKDTNAVGSSATEVDQEPPNLAVLGVSRQVRAEALATYLGRNTVVLSTSEMILQDVPIVISMDIHSSGLHTLLLTAERMPYIKTVKIHLSIHDINQQLRTATTVKTQQFFNYNGGFDSFTSLQRRDRAHEDGVRALVYLWTRMLRSIGGLVLDELVVDLTWCYCMDGCCRIVDRITPAIYEMGTSRPGVITVLGSLSKLEKDVFLAVLEWLED